MWIGPGFQMILCKKGRKLRADAYSLQKETFAKSRWVTVCVCVYMSESYTVHKKWSGKGKKNLEGEGTGLLSFVPGKRSMTLGFRRAWDGTGIQTSTWNRA